MNLLDAIAPTRALRVLELVDSISKKRRRVWVDGAAPELEQQIQLAKKPNTHVYLSIGEFAEADRRITENCLGCRVVMIDVDVRADKTYKRKYDAIVGLEEFINAFRLPQPFIVDSGGGYHIHWPLDALCPVAEWKALATAFVAAARAVGFDVDPVASINPVGMLRPPGSTNPKYKDADVRLVHSGETSSYGALRECLKDYFSAPSKSSLGLPQSVIDGPAKQLVFESVFPPVLSGPIIAGCRQMAEAPAESEPVWRLGLTVLQATTEWPSIAHTWSATAPERYNETDTQWRINYMSRSDPRPAKCETFDLARPGVCSGCRYYKKIKSPVVLGRRFDETEEPQAPHPANNPPAHTHKKEFRPLSYEPVEIDTSDLLRPVEFKVEEPFVARFAPPPPLSEDADSRGLTFDKVDKYYSSAEGFPMRQIYERDRETGQMVHVENLILFDGRCAVIATIDTAQSGVREDGVVLRFDFDNKSERVVIPLHTLSTYTDSSSFFKLIADHGIMIPDAAKAKEFAAWVRHLWKSTVTRAPRMPKIDAMGWHDEAFIVGQRQYRVDGTRGTAWLVGSAFLRGKYYESRGHLQNWQRVPAIYQEQKNIPAQFVLLTAFAAPLMPFVGEAGLLVHLHSHASGTGKSTLQHAINSVWGHPTKLMLTSRDTANSVAKLFTIANNLPVCIDEVTNMDARSVSDLVFAATQGTQKQRLTASAELRETGTWSTIVTTSANESLRDRLTSNGRTDADAENMRIVEIQMPKIPQTEVIRAEELRRAMRENYGVAGAEYVRWLVHNQTLVRRAVSDARNYWSVALKSASAERFWVACLAVCEVACDLCRHAGIFSFDWAAINDWVVRFLVPQQRRDIKESRQLHATSVFASSFLSRIAPNTLIVHTVKAGGIERIEVKRAAVGALAARYEADTKRLLIRLGAVREIAEQMQVPLQSAVAELKRMDGYTYQGEKVMFTGEGTDLAGVAGKSKHLVFKLDNYTEFENEPT